MDKYVLVATVAAALALSSTMPAAAQPAASGASNDGMLEWSVGAGVVGLRADETVYLVPGSPTELSHLYWSSVSPVLTSALKVKLPRDWTLDVKEQLGGSGVGDLVDYDWINPPGNNYSPGNWTDRSDSPNTGLDWYFNGSIVLGHDFHIKDNVTVNLNGGVKYTDVQWTASGGTYIYSSNSPSGFRDQVGSLPGGKGITYRQQLPEVIGGVDTNIVEGDWTFGLSAKAGLTLKASDADNHWLRSLLFVDNLNVAPVVSVGASAEKALSDRLKLYAAANYEKVFLARASDTIYDTTGGSSPVTFPDSAGAGLESVTVTGGLKASF